MNKFLIAFDLHDQFQDHRTVDAFLRFNKSFKPDIRICGGDIFDLTSLRHGAGRCDLDVSLAHGFELGEDFIKQFRPTVGMFGNHEDRLERIIRDGSGPSKEYAGIIMDSILQVYRDVGARVIRYNKRDYYQLADYRVVHGYHCGA